MPPLRSRGESRGPRQVEQSPDIGRPLINIGRLPTRLVQAEHRNGAEAGYAPPEDFAVVKNNNGCSAARK